MNWLWSEVGWRRWAPPHNPHKRKFRWAALLSFLVEWCCALSLLFSQFASFLQQMEKREKVGLHGAARLPFGLVAAEHAPLITHPKWIHQPHFTLILRRNSSTTKEEFHSLLMAGLFLWAAKLSAALHFFHSPIRKSEMEKKWKAAVEQPHLVDSAKNKKNNSIHQLLSPIASFPLFFNVLASVN